MWVRLKPWVPHPVPGASSRESCHQIVGSSVVGAHRPWACHRVQRPPFQQNRHFRLRLLVSQATYFSNQSRNSVGEKATSCKKFCFRPPLWNRSLKEKKPSLTPIPWACQLSFIYWWQGNYLSGSRLIMISQDTFSTLWQKHTKRVTSNYGEFSLEFKSGL